MTLINNTRFVIWFYFMRVDGTHMIIWRT